ncbi:MAG TPA: hypothetical protein DDZ89_08525 [Clostridiales bacterium]|nr:hypothetical protein [Clostridiales bacterium]
MLPWIITIISVLLLITLWLHTAKREIIPLWEAVQGADKQTRLYWGLLMGVQDNPDKKAYMQEHYDECCRVYTLQATRYNSKLHATFYAPAAWLLGFRSVPDELNI